MKSIVRVVTPMLALLFSLQLSLSPSMSASPQTQEEPMQTVTDSTSKPKSNDEHFVADSGGHLDQTLSRYDLPDDLLTSL